MALRRFEGKNVEEALDHAAEALGVERYKLGHNVVVEKRGFLGGTRRVVIEAWEDDIGNRADAPPTHIPPALAPPARDARARRPRGGRDRGGRDDRRSRGGRRENSDRDRAPRPASPQDMVFETGPTPPLPENEPALAKEFRVWLEDLFDRCGFLLDARVEDGDEKISARIYGRDAGKLMAHHGELMDSLQIIANKTLIVRSSGKTVELDCGEFREKRIGDLERQAKETAAAVREDGREKALPPMSPVERRIVHLALRDDADVETYSRGEGFYKRVVIAPKQAGSSDASPES
ncbi:MAG: Jag N-terminal domain-containing protein [Acidobacteria bacterium]|nr:Jag N-terminal domain-containing protein [Acidobacteriota bacterium]